MVQGTDCTVNRSCGDSPPHRTRNAWYTSVKSGGKHGLLIRLDTGRCKCSVSCPWGKLSFFVLWFKYRLGDESPPPPFSSVSCPWPDLWPVVPSGAAGSHVRSVRRLAFGYWTPFVAVGITMQHSETAIADDLHERSSMNTSFIVASFVATAMA